MAESLEKALKKVSHSIVKLHQFRWIEDPSLGLEAKQDVDLQDRISNRNATLDPLFISNARR